LPRAAHFIDIFSPAFTVISRSLVWLLTFINVIEVAVGEFRANALLRLDTTIEPVNQNLYVIVILEILLLNIYLIYHCNKSKRNTEIITNTSGNVTL
jgi:hypothetical protein